MEQVILPRIPSQLIRIALKDLEDAERAEHCVIDMTEWHYYQTNLEECHLCFAGAVMRGTLKVPDHVTAYPGKFGENADQLWALEDLRLGSVGCALDILGIEIGQEAKYDRRITPYHKNPSHFKADMRELADHLELNGL